MNESTTAEGKEQLHQKPHLSIGRIAGEILVGTVMGFTIAVPVAYAVAYVMLYMIYGAPPKDKNLGVEGFLVLGAMALSFLMLYGPATVVGVYLLGNRGNQTGSFLATAGGLFLAVPFIALLFLYKDMAEYKALGMAKIILWSLMFLAAPIMETLCFNLTRRYKKAPSSMKETSVKPRKIMWAVGLVVFLVAGFVAGYFLRGVAPAHDQEPAAVDASQTEASQGQTSWTCSMHPQIRQLKPGKCPICFMDLVPVNDGPPKIDRKGDQNQR